MPLQQAINDDAYLTLDQLHPFQCYIMHQKGVYTGNSYSIIKYINIKNGKIYYQVKWKFHDGSWESIAGDEQTILPESIQALSSASSFTHLYNLSLITTQTGARRLQSRKAKKHRRSRKQQTRRRYL